MDITLVNKTLATLTLVGHIGLGVFLLFSVLSYYFKIKIPTYEKLLTFLRTNALFLAFLTTIFATFMSLFYSEVAHVPPCPFCWYQRIFMFSQAVLFAIAYHKRDEHIADYSIALSGFGIFFALYHILLQSGINLYTPCQIGSLVSCSEKLFSYYGYITMPVMSLTAFVGLVILMVIIKQRKP